MNSVNHFDWYNNECLILEVHIVFILLLSCLTSVRLKGLESTVNDQYEQLKYFFIRLMMNDLFEKFYLFFQCFHKLLVSASKPESTVKDQNE